MSNTNSVSTLNTSQSLTITGLNWNESEETTVGDSQFHHLPANAIPDHPEGDESPLELQYFYVADSNVQTNGPHDMQTICFVLDPVTGDVVGAFFNTSQTGQRRVFTNDEVDFEELYTIFTNAYNSAEKDTFTYTFPGKNVGAPAGPGAPVLVGPHGGKRKTTRKTKRRTNKKKKSTRKRKSLRRRYRLAFM